MVLYLRGVVRVCGGVGCWRGCYIVGAAGLGMRDGGVRCVSVGTNQTKRVEQRLAWRGGQGVRTVFVWIQTEMDYLSS